MQCSWSYIVGVQRIKILQKSPWVGGACNWECCGSWKSSHSHLSPFGLVIQWCNPPINIGTSYNSRLPTMPHVSDLYAEFFFPHQLQLLASSESSSSIFWNDPQEVGTVSVWPVKYWITASPFSSVFVTIWKLLTFFLWRWNLNWVKWMWVLSLWSALLVNKVWLF